MSAQTCALHPLAEIVGACERCGDFGCRQCLPGNGTRCLRCGPTRIRLGSGTDAGAHTIFDPAAEPEVDGVTGDVERDVGQLKGRCILYDAAADGNIRFTLFVDEDPPKELRERAHRVIRGCLLRVPSGRLVASGIEYVSGFVERHRAVATAEDDRHHETMTSETRVPPGNYSVEAFDVEWNEAEVEREIHERVEARFGSVAASVTERIDGAPGLGCCGVLVAAFALVALTDVSGSYRPTHLIGIAFVGLFIVLPLAILWRLPGVRAAAELRRELGDGYNGVVVVLRRLPDDADVSGMPPAAFGEYPPGYFAKWSPTLP